MFDLYNLKNKNSMSLKKYSIDMTSTYSTECDSCEERDDEQYFHPIPKTNPLKYKTQLCKKFSTLGYCNYADKCKFAHGSQQLIRIPTNQHFRKKKCSKFWHNGVCPYGLRCQFGHSHLSKESMAYLSGFQALENPSPKQGESRLLRLLKN